MTRPTIYTLYWIVLEGRTIDGPYRSLVMANSALRRIRLSRPEARIQDRPGRDERA